MLFWQQKSQRIRVITLCHCTHYGLGTHAIVVQIFIFLCNSYLKLLKFVQKLKVAHCFLKVWYICLLKQPPQNETVNLYSTVLSKNSSFPDHSSYPHFPILHLLEVNEGQDLLVLITLKLWIIAACEMQNKASE